MTLLSFNTTVTGRVAVVALAGELDVAGAGLLEQELARVAADHDPKVIVIDLEELEFMDSTGLRLIVMADAQAREQGRRLAVVPASEQVHRVFEITGMTKRLEFVKSAGDVDGPGPPGGAAA